MVYLYRKNGISSRVESIRLPSVLDGPAAILGSLKHGHLRDFNSRLERREHHINIPKAASRPPIDPTDPIPILGFDYDPLA